MDWLNRTMDGTEESVNLIAKGLSHRDLWKYEKDLIFMLLEPEEQREGRAKKVFEEIFSENVPH